MRRPPAKRLAVALAGAGDVIARHGRERQQLHGVDLYLVLVTPVAASDLDLGALPQPDRHGDVAARDAFAQLRAEHHASRTTSRSKNSGGPSRTCPMAARMPCSPCWRWGSCSRARAFS